MKKKIAFCLFAILIIICFILTSGAFDGNDYGGGGGDDGGGGGGDLGGWGDSSSGDGGSSDTVIMIIFLVVFAVVFGYVFIISKKNKNILTIGTVRPSSYEGLHIQLPDRTNQIEDIIKGHDPNFSANDFIAFAKRVYIDIQTAWCKRDMATIRVFLHDNLYDATVKQVQAKIEQGVIYHYESMVVNTS